jgi:hypothetical protein
MTQKESAYMADSMFVRLHVGGLAGFWRQKSGQLAGFFGPFLKIRPRHPVDIQCA